MSVTTQQTHVRHKWNVAPPIIAHDKFFPLGNWKIYFGSSYDPNHTANSFGFWYRGYGTRRTLLSWFTWKCKLVVVWIISNHQLFCDFICKNNMEKKEYFCFSRGINPILFSKVLMSKRRINQWQKKVIKTILFVVATALTLPWERSVASSPIVYYILPHIICH